MSVVSECASSPNSVIGGMGDAVMEWSPGRSSNINIEEPFEGNSLEVLSISHGRVSSSPFASWHSSSEVDHLIGNVCVDEFARGFSHKIVEQLCSCSEDLTLINLQVNSSSYVVVVLG